MSNHAEEQNIDIHEVLGAFSGLVDPRRSNATSHVFEEMLFMALSAIIAGAEGFCDMEEFAKSKREWLESFLTLPRGIPSHDAFGDLFALLDPEHFNEAFVEWTEGLRQEVAKELVAIDGKSMRRSHDSTNGKKMVHTVSAWASENKLVLGQVATDAKSNEITAIPKLLKLLHLENCVVTMDAMGTQKSIAKQIIGQKADYILSLKDNHETFHQEVKELFHCAETLKKMKDEGAKLQIFSDFNKDHGREEKRSCVVLEKTDWFREDWQWEGLTSLIMIETQRKESQQENYETQQRFYISSLPADAEEIAHMIRRHWEIENSLHWVLDVTYREDECRVRKDHAASNLSTYRKWTLNLFKQMPDTRSIRAKQKKAAWDHKYLLQVLTN